VHAAVSANNAPIPHARQWRLNCSNGQGIRQPDVNSVRDRREPRLTGNSFTCLIPEFAWVVLRATGQADQKRLTAREDSGDQPAHGAGGQRPAQVLAARSGHQSRSAWVNTGELRCSGDE